MDRPLTGATFSREDGRRVVRALGAALGDVAASATGWIEEMHGGIAGRAFAAAGPGSTAARVVHDAVAGATYTAVKAALRSSGKVGGLAAAATPLPAHPRLAGPEAARAAGALNGLWGDHLERHHPGLAVRMAVRSDGRDVPLTRESLAATYPGAGRRLVVFVHGWCETETSWGRPAEDGDEPGTYGDRLRRDLGVAPVFLRYNSGLHISDNGEQLAGLLGALVAAWPDRVVGLDLVGHSMGGLVIRSACDIGQSGGLPWVPLVRHCVYLGTPHDGAPLEQGVNVLAGTLRLLPETRAVGTILDLRSAGVKDLRFGYVRATDWRDTDPDAVLVDTGGDVPLLATARHHVVAATIGETPRHLLSRLLGDLLVLHGSATGSGRRGKSLALADADRRHVGGIHHFRLLDHPAAEALLREWLRPENAPPGPRTAGLEAGSRTIVG